MFAGPHVTRLLAAASANRHVGQTKMNLESSRSHLVIMFRVEATSVDGAGATKAMRSCLNLIDLAGTPAMQLCR